MNHSVIGLVWCPRHLVQMLVKCWEVPVDRAAGLFGKSQRLLIRRLSMSATTLDARRGRSPRWQHSVRRSLRQHDHCDNHPKKGEAQRDGGNVQIATA